MFSWPQRTLKISKPYFFFAHFEVSKLEGVKQAITLYQMNNRWEKWNRTTKKATFIVGFLFSQYLSLYIKLRLFSETSQQKCLSFNWWIIYRNLLDKIEPLVVQITSGYKFEGSDTRASFTAEAENALMIQSSKKKA